MASRNTTGGFAQRTIKNLQYVSSTADKYQAVPAESKANESPVHLVTQIVNSLLGLVVFPIEKSKKDEKQALESKMKEIPLQTLIEDGWPDWKFDLEKPTNTLYDLVYHLRNGNAHGRVTFSTDDLKPFNVVVTFEDAPSENMTPNWRASIKASDLETFCFRLCEFLVKQ